MKKKQIQYVSVIACLTAAALSGASVASADVHDGSETSIVKLLGLKNAQASSDFNDSPTNAKLNKLHEQITQLNSNADTLDKSIRTDFKVWLNGGTDYAGQKVQLLHNGQVISDATLSFTNNRYEATFENIPIGFYYVKFTALGDTGGIVSKPIAIKKVTSEVELKGPDITITQPLLSRYGINPSGEVVIPDTIQSPSKDFRSDVVGINSNTFNGNTQILSIVLPDTMELIDTSSFSGCSNLTNVKLPLKLKIIKSQAFSECKMLTCINFPASLTQIQDSAFKDCQKLSSVRIPSGVFKVGSYAFQNCKALTGISFEEGNTTLGEYSFSGCTSLVSIALPNSIKTINACTFANDTKLATVIYKGQAYTSKSALLQKLKDNGVTCDVTAFDNTALN